jgi:type I restriction enzyme S subunit
MINSTHRTLSDNDLELIANTYHEWKKEGGTYKDVEGFCKTVTIAEIKDKKYVVAPNRFVNDKNVFNKNTILPENISSIVQSTVPFVQLTGNKVDEITSEHFISTLDKYTKLKNGAGWDELEVFQVIDEITGGEWGYDSPKDGYVECKVIRGTDFPNIPLFNLGKLPTRYIKKDKIEDKRVKAGDLIVEMSGGSKDQPTGRCVYISEYFLGSYNVPILYSNFCKRIRVNKELIDPYWFYLYWLAAYDEGLTMKYENQPSGIKNFQLDEFISSELIIVPPKDIREELLDTLKSLFEFEQLSNLNANKLKEIEKQLSYKLLSENYES